MSETAATTPAAAPAPAPAAPPPEPYDLRQGLLFASVSLLLGITQGLGVNLVNSNLTGIQGSLGATAAEASWLTTAYFATNISASLLLTKVRYQYGLRWFADIAIGVFLLLSLAHLFTQHLASAVIVRAALGLAAAPISSLTVLYMAQAFPPARALTGFMLGFATLQIGMPLSRIISGDLLQNGQWHGLHFVDAGLALVSVAAINVVRLRPMPTQPMFARGDGLAFTLYASALALFCVVLTQGRLHWWTDTPWIGLCLAAAIVLLGLYVMLELQRDKPLVDLRWLASPFMLRFIGATLLFRIVLSEQTVGAVGLMNQLGFTNDQMHLLFMCVTAGTIAGFLAVLPVLPSRKFGRLGTVALVLIMAAAWMDGQSTVLTRPHDLILSQTLLAAASAMFLASAMLEGFLHVIAGGLKNLISFIAVFSGGQALASLIGQAWLTTLLAERQRLHYAHLADGLQLADPLVVQRLAQLGGAYAASLNDGTARAGQALALLGQQLTQQSWVLAYDDLFHLIAAVSALGFLVFAGTHTHRWHRARRAAPASLVPSSS
ncbi:MFS transporter [Variovorax saccharolyticus]|uniref:MFS transporter n=1 Tax=Variovorax saccharolyticus TaxID=3053516 RepID=UPI002575F533|nr:MFS transporter [Variovorax sp. J22R187]MDM0019759.1 MFS transporter [Variovorax sp. J22R187]